MGRNPLLGCAWGRIPINAPEARARYTALMNYVISGRAPLAELDRAYTLAHVMLAIAKAYEEMENEKGGA